MATVNTAICTVWCRVCGKEKQRDVVVGNRFLDYGKDSWIGLGAISGEQIWFCGNQCLDLDPKTKKFIEELLLRIDNLPKEKAIQEKVSLD